MTCSSNTHHKYGHEAGRHNGPVSTAVVGSFAQEKAVEDEVAQTQLHPSTCGGGGMGGGSGTSCKGS